MWIAINEFGNDVVVCWCCCFYSWSCRWRCNVEIWCDITEVIFVIGLYVECQRIGGVKMIKSRTVDGGRDEDAGSVCNDEVAGTI